MVENKLAESGGKVAENEVLAAEWSQIRANMKAHLKTCSKNELIAIVFQQLDLYLEQREANKLLIEELKKVSNETSDSPADSAAE